MLLIRAKMTFMRNMSTYSRILRKAGWKKLKSGLIQLVNGVKIYGIKLYILIFLIL